MMLRLLGGISVTEDALPKAPYLEVDVGKNFLSTSHTIEHFATCNYQSDIPDAGAYEIWVENKAPTAEQRANQRWTEMLNGYVMPPMNPEIDAALCEFIARKKESMPVKKSQCPTPGIDSLSKLASGKAGIWLPNKFLAHIARQVTHVFRNSA